jgi:FkbM family methyltransferase
MSIYPEQLERHIEHIAEGENMPQAHVAYLHRLKSSGVEPKVIYDVGSCVMGWTKEAARIWPDAEIIMFDAFEPAEFLYKRSGLKYHVGVLSDVDGREVKFYQNNTIITGNSYYKERNDYIFPWDNYRICHARTLDSVVKERNFPKPDLIKIDVQGSEKDIISGALDTLAQTADMLVEIQHEQYNIGAPLLPETRAYIESLGWKCVAPLFCNNGVDGDYHFSRR